MKIFLITLAVLIQTANCQVNQNSNPASQNSNDLQNSGTSQHFRVLSPAQQYPHNPKSQGVRGSHYSKSPEVPNFQASSQFGKPIHNPQNLQSYTTYAGPPKYQGTQTQIMPVQQAYEHPFAPNNIMEDPSKPQSLSYGSNGPSFMRLLLGSMGIHFGGGRLRRPLGPKLPVPRPIPGSPLATVNSVVTNAAFPHGPGNPVHFNNHLQAVQGIAQMQHAQVSHQQNHGSGKPVEYHTSGGSNVPVTVQHYIHQTPLQSQLVAYPIANYVAGPDYTNAQYDYPFAPYGSNFYPSNPPSVMGTSIESPVTYVQSEKSVRHEEPQINHVQVSESSSSSRKPKSVNDSTYESSESSHQYEESLLNNPESDELQPYTIIEKPVVHYVEKPVVRFVEKTVVRTVAKPVIKYVEKPVIKYVRGPPSAELNLKEGDAYNGVSDESPKFIKSIEPQITRDAQHNYAQIASSQPQQSNDNSHEFYSSYGGAYFRKNPAPAPKVTGTKEVHGDNAFKKPIIHIPKELPAYSPNLDYKVIKTHIYGPTISGEGLNLPPFGQSRESKDINDQARSPKPLHQAHERFLL
ncbi:unnamed protein product [Allacma fusca]|uniref:Uncharacterized protein n=1 Tax=Allacma fusca TaxID=39272 RepID=A0A8J2K366_9HEXA|nr:unnamed protein product [Allacma fusca]